jgi:hypothetical protein
MQNSNRSSVLSIVSFLFRSARSAYAGKNVRIGDRSKFILATQLLQE